VVSPDHAAPVAEAKAADGDLIGIDVDKPVHAAGGNDGQTDNHSSYPAAYSGPEFPNVIAVAASDNGNGHPAYGTIASYLDLAAPGGVSVSGCVSTPAVEILSTWNDGGYCTIAGTSMATPHVSAAAALLRGANGACTAAQVKSRLKTTAGDLGTPDLTARSVPGSSTLSSPAQPAEPGSRLTVEHALDDLARPAGHAAVVVP